MVEESEVGVLTPKIAVTTTYATNGSTQSTYTRVTTAVDGVEIV